eukprot:gene15827-11329_t
MMALGALLLLAVQLFSAQAYENNYNVDLAKRYADFCGAAYCADPIFVKNKIDNWSCSACKNYPGVTAHVFHGNRSDANGFVAYDPKANEIIISFSGTDPLSIANWIDDIDTLKEAYPYCSGCQVHEGFYHAYRSVDSVVKSLLSSFLQSYPSASIAVTGHSLGAAMAAHCTAELTQKGYKIKASYTYGMPRVGDEAFEQWYVQTVAGTYRVVHRKDPVPQLILQSLGFHHMPYEVFYIEDPSKYTVCNSSGEDKNCQDKYVADLDVIDHLHYCGMDFTTNYLTCQV